MPAARRRKVVAPAPTSADPIDIAMDVAAHNPAPDTPAQRVLLKQEILIGWQIASERAGFALKIATGLLGLAAAVALGLEVWQASRADGLVIDAFSVPPPMAERGVTGEAVAHQLMDRINDLAIAANSSEPQRRIAGDLAQNISIQIPNTGVSLSQLDRWLKDTLGHERRVSGEVMVGEAGGLILAARNGQNPLPNLIGKPSDLPVMLQTTAETIFAREQPDSYMGYLINTRQLERAIAYGKDRASNGSPDEKARAYDQLAGVYQRLGRWQEAYDAGQYAVSLNARPSWRAAGSLAPSIMSRGHPEQAAQLLTRYMSAIRRNDVRDRLTPHARQVRILHRGGLLAHLKGDYAAQLKAGDALEGLGPSGSGVGALGGSQDVAIFRAQALAGLHETRRARAFLPSVVNTYQWVGPRTHYEVAAAGDDWTGALTILNAAMAGAPAGADPAEVRVFVVAYRARALRQLGRLAEAEALLAPSPLDCQECVTERGLLAAAKGDAKTADHWLGEAVRMAPSIPFANLEWGKVLLARGDLAKAFDAFAAANKQSPKFADPKTWLGETLMAQGKPAAAIKLFRQADRIAPNWGRNHLLWGEALARLGRTNEAKAQVRIAEGLDLTPVERARLAGLRFR